MTEQRPSTSDSVPPVGSVVPPMRRLLAMAIGVRLFVDTGIQIFAPFLAQIAAGLGISIVALGALNSVRSLMGLAAPAFAELTDRIGYRTTLRLLLLLGAAGMFIVGFSQAMWIVIIGIVLMGLGLFSFASILQAYMSALIPYERRARGLGTVEYAWALAGILGLLVSGFLIEQFSWRAPFLVLGVGLLGGFFVFGRLPSARRYGTATSAPAEQIPWQQRLRDLVTLESNVRSAWGAILAAMFIVLAVSNLSIVYGAWLTLDYGLTTGQVGIVALVLGLADLAGSALVSLRGDRLGKYRLVLLSSAAAVVAYGLLPLLNFAFAAALVGLLITRLFFEISMVANISLLSEQVPSQRAKVLTLASALVTVGAAIGSLTGPIVFSTLGVPGIGLLSAASVLAATLFVWRWVVEQPDAGKEGVTRADTPFKPLGGTVMTDIIETEWSGYHQDKDALRSRIWRRLKEQGVAPREPFGHIPSFVGAEEAAERLAQLSIWQSAEVIKSNPDTAHVALRLRALQDGKKLYMAVPRLTEERCFVELTAAALQEKGLALEDAAAWQGAMEHGRLVSPLEMEPIDLVLVGCVAVSREGGRIGKGAGFADLELGILRELGLLAPEVPIVAAVHPLQIVPGEALPMQPHDSPLDWIVTPEEVIQTHSDLPRPHGLDWDQIRPEQYESIPVLNRLKTRLQPGD